MFLDTHFVIFCAEALGVDSAQLLLTLGLGRGRGAGTRLLLPRASEGRDRAQAPRAGFGEVRRKSATGT